MFCIANAAADETPDGSGSVKRPDSSVAARRFPRQYTAPAHHHCKYCARGRRGGVPARLLWGWAALYRRVVSGVVMGWLWPGMDGRCGGGGWAFASYGLRVCYARFEDLPAVLVIGSLVMALCFIPFFGTREVNWPETWWLW